MKLSSRIDLNLLGVFEAIYSRGGVSQAARHLNLSQSAISHALARLRRTFDDQLFVRSGNALVPTALARSIIDPVRDALRGVEIAVATASAFDPATSTRSFRIGLRQASEARIFADLVKRAREVAPGITLASVNFRRGELARALAQGDLDVAIDIPSDGTAGLSALPLQTDTVVVAARRDHPVIKGDIDLDAYLAADHVIASPRPSGPGIEDEALAAIGVERHIAVRCQHIWSAWQVVADSDMIVTLLGSHAATLKPLADNRIMPFPLVLAPRTLQLHWHEASERDPGSAWLRSVIEQHFRQNPDMHHIDG